MTKVAVSGASGFLGWHIRCALHAVGIDSVPLGRAELADAQLLAKSIAECSAVVHAAGANRGDDSEIERTNVHLAEVVADAAARAPDAPLVVNLNSTHAERDTAYGRSKRAAAGKLAAALGDRFLDLILPGVFGECGRTGYNSVVATFCHQLASGDELTVHGDAPIELVHSQDVADVVISAIESGAGGEKRVIGTDIGIEDVADRLRGLHERYESGVVPSTNGSFERALFNTMRSYRFPSTYPASLEPRRDDRGQLVELIKADAGGQTFISTTRPGGTRGQHYHRRKLERFVVVEGQATISIRRLFDRHVTTFDVTGTLPVAVDMPTLHTHNITNVGASDLVTVFWTDEIFDPRTPDTYPEEV